VVSTPFMLTLRGLELLHQSVQKSRMIGNYRKYVEQLFKTSKRSMSFALFILDGQVVDCKIVVFTSAVLVFKI